jgi:hypothetical protein
VLANFRFYSGALRLHFYPRGVERDPDGLTDGDVTNARLDA